MRRRVNPWSLAAAYGTAATVPLESQVYAESAFRGADYRTHPDRLGPGIAKHVINGFPDGQSGIVGRGAFVGQLTTPLSGGRIWAMLVVPRAGLTTRIVFVQGGKLYWHQAGGTTATEIQLGGTTSFAFTDSGEHARLARYGKYLYGLEGGAVGRLFRVDVSSTGTWQAELVESLWSGIQLFKQTQNTSAGGIETATSWVVTAVDGSGRTTPASSPVDFQSDTLTSFTLNMVTLGGIPGSITHFKIWRRDTVFEDGKYRLVATVPALAGATDPNWTWTFISSVNSYFEDRVPVDDLFGQPTLELGDPPPVGATDIAVHSGRLWLAKGNTLYASWLLTDDLEAVDSGLFWTLVPDENDPAFATKGASFTIGGQEDADSIVALSQAQAAAEAGDYGGMLIAFRQNSHTFISGDTPADWRAEPGRVGEQYGCLSPRAIANIEGAWVYQSPRGPQVLVTDGASRYLGELDGQFPLEPYLSQDAFPAFLGATYSATEYRRISYLAYDRRLWVFTSSVQNNPGSTSGWVWAWSARTDGWSFLASYGFTGGVVLSTQNDAGQLYLAGRDGQLYRYDPTSRLDKPTPSHPGNSYDLSLVSRNHGADGGAALFSPARPVALQVDVTCETSSSYLDWDVVPGDNPNNLSAANWSRLLLQGRNVLELSAPSDVRGYSHAVNLKITNAGPGTRISGYLLTCVEQGARRI